MQRRKTEKLALLIDVLNWITPILDWLTSNGNRNDGKKKVEQSLHQISDRANAYGRVELKKAFADFSDPNVPDWLPYLLISKNIELVYTPGLNSSKRMDDMMLAREIFLLPYQNPQITTIFCVTGDGDLFPAMSSYQSTGRRAMILSTNGTSTLLKDYCDGFWQIPLNAPNDDDNALLTRIEALLSDGKGLHKEHLLEALQGDDRCTLPPNQINKQLSAYIKQGILRYEETAINGYHSKVLRLNNEHHASMR